MITQLKFHNFRILQDATLPLGRITVIIGPNESGKSTALEALKIVAANEATAFGRWLSLRPCEPTEKISIEISSSDFPESTSYELRSDQPDYFRVLKNDPIVDGMRSARVFCLDAVEIAKPCPLRRTLELSSNGSNLAAVLTSLQDQYPERFELLNRDLNRWTPDFDRVMLDFVGDNQRTLFLRTSEGKHQVPAADLSQGTLVALALLAMSHLPTPPSIVALEEIDRGIHPRRLRDIQDAVVRLAYPESDGDKRDPVQVIMTTHSPYFVNLFRDHPEDIVIAEKQGLSASFHRLVDIPHYDEILRNADLGEAWFIGALGGVPAGT
jgi:predicted ATPase